MRRFWAGDCLGIEPSGGSGDVGEPLPERGEQASRLLGLPFTALSGFSVEGYELIINATPVGSRTMTSPLQSIIWLGDAVVVDLVYAPGITASVAAARTRGVRVVEGREVLRAEVERQFARMTRLAPPFGLVADMLGLTRDAQALDKLRGIFLRRFLLSRTELSRPHVYSISRRTDGIDRACGKAGSRDVCRPRAQLR